MWQVKQVTFQFARLRMVPATLRRDASVAGSASPQVAPVDAVSEKLWVRPKFALNKWVDVLRFVDPVEKRQLRANGLGDEAEISCERQEWPDPGTGRRLTELMNSRSNSPGRRWD